MLYPRKEVIALPYIIRPASAADAAACAGLYAPYTRTLITFESPAPDAAEMARRISGTMENYPWLVCERDGEVLGYSYAHRFRTRAAYDWDAELSIYLRQGCGGRGIGGALYTAVLELLREMRYVNAYGTVSVPNQPSERLHEKCGFKRVCVFENTGWKLGEWRGLAFYHLQLNEYAENPAPVVPFPELPAETAARICADCAARLNK